MRWLLGIYQFDTGRIEHGPGPGDLTKRLLDEGRPPFDTHRILEKDRKHFCKVVRTVYNFRNDRAVAHISPLHTANQLDSYLIMGSVKWLLAEFLRLVWKNDRTQVAVIIENIIQVKHPLIHEFEGKPLILSNDLSVPEEILLVLEHSSDNILTRFELKQYIPASSSNIDVSITRLVTAHQVRISSDGRIMITPLGYKRILEGILPKLT